MAGPWQSLPRAHFPPVAVLHRELAHIYLSLPLSGMSVASHEHLPVKILRSKGGQAGRLTVHGDLDGQAAALADGVLHYTAVQVIVLHEHPGDGEHLLVGGQEHSRVIEEGLAILQPGVAGLGAIFM